MVLFLGFGAGFKESFDFVEVGGERLACVAEDDLARVFVTQHIAAMLQHFAERLLRLHEVEAIANGEPLDAAFL